MYSEDGVPFLTPEEAKSCLIPGDSVHCILNPSVNVLIGADWSREKAESLLDKAETIRVGGESCRRMNHCVVAFFKGEDYFFENDEEKINEIMGE